MDINSVPTDSQLFSTDQACSSSASPQTFTAPSCACSLIRDKETDPDSYALQNVQREISGYSGPRRCGLKVLPHCSIGVYDDNSVSFNGLKLCRSGVCYYCLKHKSVQRAEQFTRIMHKAQATGHQLVMCVLTLRSGRVSNTRLKEVLFDASRKLLRKSFLSGVGVAGYMRSTETTIATSGRMHIHSNLVLVVRAGVSMLDLETSLFQKWRSSVVSVDKSCTPDRNGFFFTEVDDIEAVGNYVTSVKKVKSIAQEVTLAPWKLSNYSKTSRSVFEILRDIYFHGRSEDIRLFRSWENIFYNTRRTAVSHKLESMLDGLLSEQDVEPSDFGQNKGIEGKVLKKIVPCSPRAMSYIVHHHLRPFFAYIYASNDPALKRELDLFEKLMFVDCSGLLDPDELDRYLSSIISRMLRLVSG